MGVFLTILKWLGIILLILLALALCIILLVLLVPFRYKAAAQVSDPESHSEGQRRAGRRERRGAAGRRERSLDRRKDRKADRQGRRHHQPGRLCVQSPDRKLRQKGVGQDQDEASQDPFACTAFQLGAGRNDRARGSLSERQTRRRFGDPDDIS